mgnify:CR=1 FL=1
MELEQTLQFYEIRKGEIDKVTSYGGLYELLSGGCPTFKINLSGPSSSRSRDLLKLDGGVYIDLVRSTMNTVILKEPIAEGLQNVYVHHDRGPGRVDSLVEMYDKIIEKIRKDSLKAINTRTDGY